MPSTLLLPYLYHHPPSPLPAPASLSPSEIINHPFTMPIKRVTRSSSRILDATPANPPAPAPAHAETSQTSQGSGNSPRRTRSGRILGQIASVATKLTGGRRVRKTATIETIDEVHDSVCVVPATDPDPPQPRQAPAPRKRGGKAAKQIDSGEHMGGDDLTVPSLKTAPAAPPAPSKPTAAMKRTRSSRKLPGKAQLKTAEPATVDNPPEPTAPSVPPIQKGPSVPKTVEEFERIAQDIRDFNHTVLTRANLVKRKLDYQTSVYVGSRLTLWDPPKEALYLLHNAYIQEQPSLPYMNDPQAEISSDNEHPGVRDADVTLHVPAAWDEENPDPVVLPSVHDDQREPAPVDPIAEGDACAVRPGRLQREGAVILGQPEIQPAPESQSTQAAAAAVSASGSNAPSRPRPAPLKRHNAVNWGYPPGYHPEGSSSQPAVESISVSGAGPLPKRAPLKRHNAVNLGYPEDYRPSQAPEQPCEIPASNHGPAVSVDGPATAIVGSNPAPNGRAAPPSVSAPSAVRRPGRLQRSDAVILGYPEGYTPRSPWPSWVITRSSNAVDSQASQNPAAVPRRPLSRSRAREEELDEQAIEADLSVEEDPETAEARLRLIRLEHDVNNALMYREPGAVRKSTPARRRSGNPLTRQAAHYFDEDGNAILYDIEDDDEIVQQVIGHVLHEVAEERAARLGPSGSQVPLTLHEPGPGPSAAPAESHSQPQPSQPGVQPKPKATGAFSSGMSAFAPRPVGNSLGNAKGQAAPTSPDKGKKRARESDDAPQSLTLWGYATSAGPLKVNVSLFPIPKRQKLSDARADAATAEDGGAAASPDVQPRLTGGAKRSREEFEEDGADTGTAEEASPAKKSRVDTQ
ncbi:hypothetical protein DICSQDRAFT_180398 [Dichomitus squalens LYAD-421 SS1]|uniref:Uncharacterized protein n=1 Tax=Dichomitus squalens (strain LYAD-421) TaxID=732165 RepID=R7T1E2_DICSQ|nr:uncharacterized protein DICSQDRAFT_180398 [Dichomitus squalens LYAD-421 SS1]EJF62078.1 hypothetical protein DICSQDRAFT_180398 [Dichomitus squalens LYAD-421 SS1]